MQYMNFKQHVNELTQKQNHTLDLVTSFGLNTDVLSVVDLALSDHYYAFFNASYLLLTNFKEQVFKKCCLTPEVTSNFLQTLPKFI